MDPEVKLPACPLSLRAHKKNKALQLRGPKQVKRAEHRQVASLGGAGCSSHPEGGQIQNLSLGQQDNQTPVSESVRELCFVERSWLKGLLRHMPTEIPSVEGQSGERARGLLIPVSLELGGSLLTESPLEPQEDVGKMTPIKNGCLPEKVAA